MINHYIDDEADRDFDPLENYDEEFINILLYGDCKKPTPKKYIPRSNIRPNRELSLESLRDLCLSVESNEPVNTNFLAYRLLEAVNDAPRYDIDTIRNIPFRDGIYLFFEEGIQFGDLDRVVFVGDHRQGPAITSRITQHFKYSTKHGSVLHRYLGAALLSVNKNPYLDIWMEPMTNKELIAEKYGDAYDPDFELKITLEIREYLAEHMTVACIPYPDQKKRTALRNSIVETLQNAYFSFPAKNWLGRLSPYTKIANYGLWQKGLDKARSLSYDELHVIEHLCEDQ